MSELLSQDWFRTFGSAGLVGVILVGIVQVVVAVVNRRMPSADIAQANEQTFRKDLIGRIQKLEGDLATMGQQASAINERYWELETRYKLLEHDHEELKQQHENLLVRYREQEKRIETLIKLSQGRLRSEDC